ncbi:flagellar hook-associated protein FlgK [Rhodospirillum rubrum]|uniref:Flagellar hook-associated protein 1 n=1 Tax=Rhodospirillum rubrum (strain ATCC 11170 / ATH 1.1.1 / DSM 467 / LMG 4362 / NCIMB 8255 / S1) TaxID=269796 RepID=Q2RQE6_RHORT|nr:flagellar hook-associated protein FlgK [Rhodospirillum rubrum]ABC23649.1 conserved hypothetical protein [Rhodospirillum rubrum ATCC 11170]AEO49387.1 hypothetical protein F11_14625 [Rhodospirillum rubrum F11]MBK5955325.1 flagellar hook-associated protein FlgK [Rhodospirillum rubrum]QXG79609.1 flagellar hook-associated protein FlgK [Rhodospirillum rubrum]HAP99381.1 flagellar hook-associated protein FlgK [Rhodospirillum rubrum]
MSLNLALSAGISGLQTAQKGLDLVSHNLANINTPGYTRKIFNPESVVLNGSGVGVQTGTIARRVDEGLNRDLREELAKYTEYKTKASYYQRMQDLFGKPASNNSISHNLTAFGQQFDTLALETDKSTQQMATVRSAQELTSQFNTISTRLQQMRLTADQDIAGAVAEVNGHLKNIDTLNDEITLGVATGRDVTDLQDKRDLEVQQLTELVDVTTFERPGGALVVYTKGGSTLLDADPIPVSFTASSSVTAWDSKGGGDFSAISVGGSDITGEIGAGKLAALIDMRDKTVPAYQSQMDELAGKFSDSINQIHNRGTSQPTIANSYSGTTTFIAPATQTMALTTGDVAITLFNADGTQKATTTLKTIVPAVATGEDISTVTTAIQTWLNSGTGGGLTGATATVDANGKVQIKLGTNTASLAFRDQASTTAGSTAGDVTIAYDADGNGTTDQTVSGFANFLGLNDMFVANRGQWMADSDVKAQNWTPNVGGALTFYDSNNPPGGTAIGTLTIAPNETLKDIALKINSDTALSAKLEAEVVQDGDGYRLRIKDRAGKDMVITQTAGVGTGLIEQLGLKDSKAGLSGQLRVNQSLLDDSSRISRGAVLFNSDTGQYYISAGDNTTANQLAKSFQTAVSFDAAGGVTTGARSFSDYAALTLSQNASEASAVATTVSYQSQLADTLQLKSAEISAVNMDEELSQLLVWEQMYRASAKVISAAADMLDVLNSIIR